MIQGTNLVQYLLRMPKADSSFFYFVLEANEGIAFYSTMPFTKGQMYRDIQVTCTKELDLELSNIIKHCNSKLSIEELSRIELAE